MHGGRNVLDLLLADVGELHGQLIGHLLVHGARDADAADRRDAFQPRRDVDAVAEQVAVALDHIADRDSDAEIHLPAGRIGHIARAQALLNIDRAAHRFDRAREFGQHGVACGIEDAAAGAGDEIVHHRPVGCEAPQRLFFVLGDEPAIACDIGGKNRRDFPFHGALAESDARTMRAPAAARNRLAATQ